MVSNELIAHVYISMLWREKRKGKGFSKAELAKAGLTVHEAKIHNIPIDSRRRTKHDWNVQALTQLTKVIPLLAVKGIGKVIESKLKAAGINDARALINCDLEELIVTHGFSEKSLVRWQHNAKKLLEDH